MALYANVIVDLSLEKLDHIFQYRIPAPLQESLQPGMQVLVPFGKGNRGVSGYVLELTDEANWEVDKIKELIGLKDDGICVEAQLLALAGWIRDQYGGTLNGALRTVMPVRQKEGKKEERTLLLTEDSTRIAEKEAEYLRRNSVARLRLLQKLRETGSLPYGEALKTCRVNAEQIRVMEEAGLLRIEKNRSWRNPISTMVAGMEEEKRICLNPQQSRVVEEIRQDFAAGKRETYLLHGVTGSGKTAVYLELIEQVIKEGKQVIVLIPEIALTRQTVSRFYGRFGERVSILNSRMSPGQRFDQFERAKEGAIDVMIGPRSALFTPFPNLGLIVVDEEHETSYNSENTPRYHAVEVARKRGELAKATVLLGSATPSLDSYQRAKSGEYRLLTLKNRVEERPLPLCEIVDMRKELQQGNRSVLSLPLQEAIEESLEKKEQVMLFLNRRGISGMVSCRNCGHVFLCPHCNVSLSQHGGEKLLCHYCGYQEPMVHRCPQCGSPYVSGFKTGTQKIQQLVEARFPMARVLRMDADTTKTRGGYEKILSTFGKGEADILIGTQMIVKGHDFPRVTVVGILAADLSLYANDYRCGERTFQLITQAAGRSGRGVLPGKVFIQSYHPDHYAIELAAKQDYEGFFREEIFYRNLMEYPPAGELMAMLFSHPQEETVEACAQLIAQKIQQAQEKGKLEGLTLLGPSPATISKVKDQYRRVLYLKHKNRETLNQVRQVLEDFIKKHRELDTLSIQFDTNPRNGF